MEVIGDRRRMSGQEKDLKWEMKMPEAGFDYATFTSGG
jgi:hypothetical protein